MITSVPIAFRRDRTPVAEIVPRSFGAPFSPYVPTIIYPTAFDISLVREKELLPSAGPKRIPPTLPPHHLVFVPRRFAPRRLDCPNEEIDLRGHSR